MAKRCSNSHGGGGGRTHSPYPDVFSFFKIMIGPFRSTLYIPPKAARKLENLVDHLAYLEDSNGKCWKVEVSLVEKSLAFNQGWGQFVLDHNIIAGEFVVFKYNGRQKFSLQIFGLSGCERLYFPVKREEDILKLNNSALSNDPPPIKGAKPSIQTESNSVLYEEQSLHIKNALGRETAERHISKTPPITKNMVSMEVAEMCHETNAKKRRKVDNAPKETFQFAIDSGGCHSLDDALDIQNVTNTEGVKFLVTEDGVCFLVIGEHAINEPNQTLTSPISVDVSAMTYDTLPFVSNEVLSCDHEMSMVPSIFPALNSCDNHDAAVEDPATRNLQEDDMGHAPDTSLKEVPSDEAAQCPFVGHAPDMPLKEVPSDGNAQCPKFTGKSLEIVVTKEVPSDENPLQCVDHLPECPGSPKPVGDQVLALPEPVRLSFTVAAEIQPYQELPSSLPTKRMRIDRKVVLLRDSSQRVWPIVYHENHNAKFTGFSSGWSAFASANGIKGGDRCVLELASEVDALFDAQMPLEKNTFSGSKK